MLGESTTPQLDQFQFQVYNREQEERFDSSSSDEDFNYLKNKDEQRMEELRQEDARERHLQIDTSMN